MGLGIKRLPIIDSTRQRADFEFGILSNIGDKPLLEKIPVDDPNTVTLSAAIRASGVITNETSATISVTGSYEGASGSITETSNILELTLATKVTEAHFHCDMFLCFYPILA